MNQLITFLKICERLLENDHKIVVAPENLAPPPIKKGCSRCGSKISRHKKTCPISTSGNRGNFEKLEYLCFEDDITFYSNLSFDNVECPKNPNHKIVQK